MYFHCWYISIGNIYMSILALLYSTVYNGHSDHDNYLFPEEQHQEQEGHLLIMKVAVDITKASGLLGDDPM